MLHGMQAQGLLQNDWVFDTGSTSHMCCVKEEFIKFQSHKEKIELAANLIIYSVGIGKVRLETTRGELVILEDVLFVPQLKFNFISVGTLVTKNCVAIFKGENMHIEDKSRNVIISGERLGQLYACHGKKKSSICSFISMSSNFKLWHQRFGHLNGHQLTELARNQMVRGLDDIKIPKDFKCETCLKGKICVTSFPKSEAYRSNEILGLVHSDICGPMRIASCGGAIYFLTFIDDFSRMIFLFPKK